MFIGFYADELALFDKDSDDFLFAELDFVCLSERFDDMADSAFSYLIMIAEQPDETMRRYD